MARKGSKTLLYSDVCYWLVLLCIAMIAMSACGGGGSTLNTGEVGGGGSGAGGSTGGGGTGGGKGSGAFTAGRTKYVRTDAATEYYGWINSHWIIYNAVTNRFYVADPSANRVIVMDAASESEVAVINVPGAYSIDDTPDHKMLYVASATGDVYVVDPIALAVTSRYMASEIGSSGYATSSALVMADGRLALLGGSGGVSLDGSANFALWNISNNSLTVSGCNNFIGNIGNISRTPDRTKIILASVDGGQLCEFDESTGQSNNFGPGGFPAVNFRISPDGKYIVVPTNTLTLAPNSYAYVYDASTLNLISQIQVSGETSTAAGFAISADSKTLFVPNDWIIYAYDLATGQQVGWIPNMNVPVVSGGGAWGPITGPNLQAVDHTGLLVGPLEEGVGFIDTTTMRTGSVGSQFTNGYLNPATGSTSGNTQVQITEPGSFGALKGVYFGTHGSPDISGVSGPNTYGNFGSITATTPPGAAGPVDVYALTADGGVQILPEAFSYGPSIVEVVPNVSTGEGGGTGVIYGYGFGPVGYSTEGPVPQISGNASNGIPSSLHVSVGGIPARVTGYAPYAYPTQSPPFPLQALAYTIPPGSGTVDVTVSSSSGSSTAGSALTYLPPIQEFALSQAALAQGVYDPYTDLYYFTDTNKIQVFSSTLGSWQAPITIPASTAIPQRLWGIALSPNGSKLAVADALAGTIYVLNPANPASVKTFIVSGEPGGAPIPCGVAISDTGMVYYVTVGAGIGGGDQFYKLNSNTGKITNYGIEGPDFNGDAGLRTLISSDNSRVFFNDDGYAFYIDTATDKMIPAFVDQPCCYGDYELALSANQSQFEASGYLYDYDLNSESYYALNDREILNIAYVYGAKLSPDGNMLFQPSTNGIDVFDARLGNLINRISLPVALSINYDALVADGKDNILVAITGETGDGIAVIDLSSIKEQPGLSYSSSLVSDFPSPTRRPESNIQPLISHKQSTKRVSSALRRVRHVTKPLSRISGTTAQ